MNIMVLNLHRDINSNKLYKMFKVFGKVESCEVVVDKEKGLSKGFAFVKMKDNIDANKAILGLHGKQVGNQKIRVKEADKNIEQ